MPRGGFETGRVFGPDLARGIALLGMFAAHVAFEGPEHFYDGRSAILFEQPVGRGKVIYVGWSFAKFIPGGRNLNSTIEDEQRYEAQYHVLSNIASELYPASESR